MQKKYMMCLSVCTVTYTEWGCVSSQLRGVPYLRPVAV